MTLENLIKNVLHALPIPFIAIGGATIAISGTLLYVFQRNLIYTSFYPSGSRKNVCLL